MLMYAMAQQYNGIPTNGDMILYLYYWDYDVAVFLFFFYNERVLVHVQSGTT